MTTLDVWGFGRRAGALDRDDDGLSFAYTEEWLADGRPPLSQSLPLDGAFGSTEVHAFFGGLLPEGDLRDLLARRFGVSAANDFALLEAVGGDCAGAVSLLTRGASPPTTDGDVHWLDEQELAGLLVELPQRPMFAEPGGEYRLSLAGVQDKLPVVVDGSNIGLPRGGHPSTHVLKAPIRRLPATVINEAFCLAVGRALGIDVVHATPRRLGDAECLIVERYDRVTADGQTTRLHQEDFCQALGIPSEQKYQREGGPGLDDCFALLRRATRATGAELPRFLDQWALSFLAGDHDAHGKNFSLLYRPDGTGLAPAYDIVSTVVYWKVAEMDRKMAMHVGGEYRPAYVRARHLDSMLESAGVNVRLARRRLAALAAATGEMVEETKEGFAAEHWWDPTLDKIVATFEERSQWLSAITR